MKQTILAGIAALFLAAPVMAGTILAYDTVNQTGEVTAGEVGAGVTAYNLKRDFGLLSYASGADYNSRSWTIGGDEATAVAGGDQLVWGFSSGTSFDLTTLDIAYDRSPTGPSSFSILASINGGIFTQIFVDLAVGASTTVASINLSPFTNVTQAFFLMPGWGATGAAGTFDVETGNVGPNSEYGLALNGMPTIAAVPLPAGLPLLAGALGVMGFVRRKRKAA